MEINAFIFIFILILWLGRVCFKLRTEEQFS